MKYRMYILPDPIWERPLLPTNIEFELEEDVDNFIAYDLEKWKVTEMEEHNFGYGYGPEDPESVLEVTFLKVF